MLERAIALRRENANTAHALTHAMFEDGAGEEAEKLIAGWLPDYPRSGILHGHIAWHAALTALERGDADAALALYAGKVRHSVSLGTPINIVSDAASLLWRLQAYGHGVPEGLSFAPLALAVVALMLAARMRRSLSIERKGIG